MSLVNPDLGTLFWMTIAFFIVLVILRKFAWTPILSALAQRESSIESALNAAEKARKNLDKLQADNEKILRQAKVERDELLKEAREIKTQILSEAKEEATEEARKIIDAARVTIENERITFVNVMKKQVASFSVEIAEKILKEKLADDAEQKKMVHKLIDDLNLN